jgi:hypothetical protein
MNHNLRYANGMELQVGLKGARYGGRHNMPCHRIGVYAGAGIFGHGVLVAPQIELPQTYLEDRAII